MYIILLLYYYYFLIYIIIIIIRYNEYIFMNSGTFITFGILMNSWPSMDTFFKS